MAKVKTRTPETSWREEKAGSSGKNRPRNDNFFEVQSDSVEVQSDGVNDDGLAPEGRPLHGDEGTGVHSQKWLGH
jgi:hypothetical protein